MPGDRFQLAILLHDAQYRFTALPFCFGRGGVLKNALRYLQVGSHIQEDNGT